MLGLVHSFHVGLKGLCLSLALAWILRVASPAQRYFGTGGEEKAVRDEQGCVGVQAFPLLFKHAVCVLASSPRARISSNGNETIPS